MKLLAKYLKPYVLILLICVALLFTQAFCELTLPNLMSEMVNRGIVLGETNTIWQRGLLMLGVALLGVAAAIALGFLTSRLGAKFSSRLRRDVFIKVMGFSNAQFDTFSTASLITRTTNDVQQLQMVVTMGLRMVCFAPIMGIGGIVFALQKSTSLAWTIAVAVIVLLGLMLCVYKLAVPRFTLLQKLTDNLNLVSRENLSGMMVVRAFSNEQYEEQRFDDVSDDLRRTNRFVMRVMSAMFPAMTLIMNFMSLSIVWLGGQAIAQGGLLIGDMIAFTQYAMQIIMSFLMIAMMFVFLPRAAVSLRRLNEVLGAQNTVINPTNPVQVPHVRGEVAFNNVAFRYPGAQSSVIEEVSFTAKAGTTTAFIGSTGSGKSTLINLLPRFYDVTQGSITIDGVDIRNFDLHELREMIGYVPQQGVLFQGDIDSNVRYGKPGATTQEVSQALLTAQADQFVESIYMEIAQGGDNVSGGQKQRLAIARALVKQAPIYVFDDSFSALDFKTDAALRQALNSTMGDRTVFVVAQRISTIMGADNIVVLDQGRVVGMGTHKQLLTTCPEYLEIAESQLTKEALA